MTEKNLQDLLQEAGKSIKTDADLNEFRAMVTKVTVEAVLNAELDDHLDQSDDAPNSRNGYSRERLQTEDGEFEFATPRDRSGNFEPQLVKNTSAGSPPWMTKSCSCTHKDFRHVKS